MPSLRQTFSTCCIKIDCIVIIWNQFLPIPDDLKIDHAPGGIITISVSGLLLAGKGQLIACKDLSKQTLISESSLLILITRTESVFKLEFFNKNKEEILFLMEDIQTDDQLSNPTGQVEVSTIAAKLSYDYPSSSVSSAEDVLIELLDAKREILRGNIKFWEDLED